MIVLGLLLILVAVGAVVFAVTAPSATAQMVDVTALGVTVSASPLAMFVAGAVSLLLLALGYVLISRGTRRKARSRKELRTLRKEQAAAGASSSPEGGHRSSRHDRAQREASAEADPEPRADLTKDRADLSRDDSKDGNKDLQPERQPDSEPHSST